MTPTRIKEAITAWQKISDACAASCDIEWILNDSKHARSFYLFETERTDWGETYWLNVDEIICVEVYRKHGDKEWRVSPNIEIVDPVTNDWDGINYNVNEFYPAPRHNGKTMKTKTLSNIREQYGRLWLAALGNVKRCNTLDRIYWQYVRNIKKHLNVRDPFAYKPYYTPVPASIYAKQV